MERSARARWHGGIKDGSGKLTTDSGVLDDTPYGFRDRFEDGPNTNPEELIAAAHAGCFSMALSGQLGQKGLTAESIETTATVSLEKQGEGFAITAVHLELEARVPEAEREAFLEAANNAKAGCPVSKLLNAEITLQAELLD